MPLRRKPTVILLFRQLYILKHRFNFFIRTQRHRRIHHITRQMRRKTLDKIIHIADVKKYYDENLIFVVLWTKNIVRVNPH